VAEASWTGRVLHVSMPTVAGVPTVLLSLVEEQLAGGWSVSVACPPEGWLAAAAAKAGAHVLSWPATRAPGPRVVGETYRLARLIASERPNVVHLHSSKAGLAGRLAIRGRYPTVFQPHAWSFLALQGPPRLAAVRWEQFAARWTDAIVCVSNSERLVGAMNGVRAPTYVIANAVDCAKLAAAGPEDRAVARMQLGLSDRPRAVCIGRLCRQKGQLDLIDAWDDVREAVTEAEFVLVGDGPDRTTLQQRLSGRRDVVLAGERDDVPSWLAAADVVVVPSRWEGMALAPLEAMACARCVVATDVGGIAESVPPTAGAVVAPGDRKSLAHAIAVRLADGARAAAEGEAGRRHVEHHHDRTAAARAVVSLYSMLLRQRTRVQQGGRRM
jgi:glycosyltransferase involved in cell wall biosynthesis